MPSGGLGRQTCRDCGCNSHCWAKASRQGAAAAAAGMHRLLGDLRAAAGEGREETGLEQSSSHPSPPETPSSPPLLPLWLRNKWATERKSYQQVLGKLRANRRLQRTWQGCQHLPG